MQSKSLQAKLGCQPPSMGLKEKLVPYLSSPFSRNKCWLYNWYFITISWLIIWKPSDHFDIASEYLSRNLSEGVSGATINVIGSSMPQLFTTLFFLFILQVKDGVDAEADKVSKYS